MHKETDKFFLEEYLGNKEKSPVNNEIFSLSVFGLLNWSKVHSMSTSAGNGETINC